MRINHLSFELVFVRQLPFSHFHIMSKAMLSSARLLIDNGPSGTLSPRDLYIYQDAVATKAAEKTLYLTGFCVDTKAT